MPPFFSRLDLKNFKSYRDEVYIEWKQSSSIVGPNGVGKSTIIDAIEYVFCFPAYNKISVAQLRKDICNNSYSSPDDCPSTTVRVTFHHKNGEQEIFERTVDYNENVHRYSINDEEVSVKDYKKRLLECNINSKANNFLVKQNSIEYIATMNEKERCEFFERSSNSIAYKRDYNRLQKELKQASNEVEASKKQLKFFSIQKNKLGKYSKALEEYEKLQEDLKDVEFEYYFAKLRKIDEAMDQIRQNKEELSTKIRVADKLKKSYKKNIDDIKKALEEDNAEAQLEKLQKKLAKYSQKQKELEQFLMLQEHKIKKIEANKKTTEERDAACKKTIKNLEEQLARVQKEKEEMERLASLSSSIKLNDDQYDEYLRLKSECIKNCAKEIQLKDSIQRNRDIVNDKIEDYERKQKLLLNEIEMETTHLQKLKNDVDQTKKHCDHTNSEIEKISSEIYELEMNIQNHDAEMKTLNDKIIYLTRKIGNSKDTVELNKKTRIKNEVIEKLKSHFPGVYGRLKNLCDIVDERYNIAVTKILGNQMNSIVVDKTDTALKCIDFVKEQYAGCQFNVKETYLPINYITVPDQTFVKMKIKDVPNAVLATEIVTGNNSDEINRVLLHVLGKVVICKTDDEAMKLSHEKRIECVSWNGTLCKVDGVFSGGSVTLSEKSRVWNEKEIENLKKQREDNKDEMKKLYAQIRGENEMKHDMEIKLSGLQSRLKNYLQPLLAEKQNQLKADQNKLSKLVEDLSIFENTSNVKELKLDLEKIDNNLMEIKKKIEEKESLIFATFCQKLNIDNIQQYEKEDVKKYEQRCNRKQQIYGLLHNIESQIEYEKSRCSKDDVKKLDEELAIIKEQCRIGKEDQVALDNKIDEINKQIQLAKQKLVGEKKRKELKMQEKHLKLVNNDLREWNSNLTSADVKMTGLKAEKHETLMNCLEKGVDIPLTDSKIQKVVMGSKVAINTESESSSNNQSESDSQIQEKDVIIDYTKLPKTISDLQEEGLSNYIKSLEKKRTEIIEHISCIDVNPKTKQEFEKMKEKVKVLSNQHKKLLNKQVEIKNQFDEVKNQRAEKFSTFFNYVEKNIEGIFKKLYQSASAQAFVHARSSDEPYLHGISFDCIIPEKRFGRMTNFSGGEKTMSAIALLIATYNAIPTSFLIFDEIDAALDNSNIDKVIKYFNELKPTTQIINISHHNQMSAFADAIVGVNFSPQKATSYVVHIDLSKYQKEEQREKCLTVTAEERLAALR